MHGENSSVAPAGSESGLSNGHGLLCKYIYEPRKGTSSIYTSEQEAKMKPHVNTEPCHTVVTAIWMKFATLSRSYTTQVTHNWATSSVCPVLYWFTVWKMCPALLFGVCWTNKVPVVLEGKNNNYLYSLGFYSHSASTDQLVDVTPEWPAAHMGWRYEDKHRKSRH